MTRHLAAAVFVLVAGCTARPIPHPAMDDDRSCRVQIYRVVDPPADEQGARPLPTPDTVKLGSLLGDVAVFALFAESESHVVRVCDPKPDGPLKDDWRGCRGILGPADHRLVAYGGP